jgi:DNA polymerase I-like protein with 3'-5' exonuclease and polymerase domains
MANAQLPTQEEIDQAMQALNATAGKILAAFNQLVEATGALSAVFDKLLNIPTGGDDE